MYNQATDAPIKPACEDLAGLLRSLAADALDGARILNSLVHIISYHIIANILPLIPDVDKKSAGNCTYCTSGQSHFSTFARLPAQGSRTLGVTGGGAKANNMMTRFVTKDRKISGTIPAHLPTAGGRDAGTCFIIFAARGGREVFVAQAPPRLS